MLHTHVTVKCLNVHQPTTDILVQSPLVNKNKNIHYIIFHYYERSIFSLLTPRPSYGKKVIDEHVWA